MPRSTVTAPGAAVGVSIVSTSPVSGPSPSTFTVVYRPLPLTANVSCPSRPFSVKIAACDGSTSTWPFNFTVPAVDTVKASLAPVPKYTNVSSASASANSTWLPAAATPRFVKSIGTNESTRTPPLSGVLPGINVTV